MGSDTIPNRTDNTTIFAEHVNILKRVLAGDILPRNVSGVTTDLGGGVGSSTYRFDESFFLQLVIGAVASGLKIQESSGALHFKVGDVLKMVLDSNGIDGNYLKADSVLGAAMNVATLQMTVTDFSGTTFAVPSGVTRCFIVGCGAGGGGGGGGGGANGLAAGFRGGGGGGGGAAGEIVGRWISTTGGTDIFTSGSTTGGTAGSAGAHIANGTAGGSGTAMIITRSTGSPAFAIYCPGGKGGDFGEAGGNGTGGQGGDGATGVYRTVAALGGTAINDGEVGYGFGAGAGGGGIANGDNGGFGGVDVNGGTQGGDEGNSDATHGGGGGGGGGGNTSFGGGGNGGDGGGFDVPGTEGTNAGALTGGGGGGGGGGLSNNVSSPGYAGGVGGTGWAKAFYFNPS